ncbi:hypothetical protein [Streptomyces sp. NPDC046197]|uniref:hypothetical protein n=1 Tax=Streptomyces sp. NPDC046197 TaxID=3154337 RepID=UPI0033DEF9ED
MTPEVLTPASHARGADQLRRLHGAYAAGTALWTVSLFVALLGHEGDVRQVVLLLALLAAFALLWLWSTWLLWRGGDPGGPRPRR